MSKRRDFAIARYTDTTGVSAIVRIDEIASLHQDDDTGNWVLFLRRNGRPVVLSEEQAEALLVEITTSLTNEEAA